MSGLFGKIMGAVEGIPEGSPPGAGNLVSEVLSSAGGVSGLISLFNRSGLGDKAASWVGSGQNISVMASEVTKVFPADQLEALAVKHGVPAGMVAQILAHALPQAVDQATPSGALPAESSDGN